MKAIIFAAGEVTRLRPLTYTTPKPLLLIGQKPILFHIINSLPEKIDEVIIVVSYLADKIIETLNSNQFGRSIKFVHMNLDKERGTWSALWQVKKMIEKDNSKFLVLNGDDYYSKEELQKMISVDSWAVGYCQKNNPGANYRNIVIDDNDNIIAMPLAESDQGIINVATGVYLLDSTVFSLTPVKTASGEFGLPQTISQLFGKKPVKAIKMNLWLQINTMLDLEMVNEYLKKSK